ncbi:MAG: methylated-DNA--[protein]-cysteine S-methyltransferase, partial [Selenomonadaceae bacterium]
LQNIPYGETKSYKQVAKVVGSPQASRAVGMANHRNPVMIVIPCHRVIGTNGSLVGYSGGVALKEKLLALESGAIALKAEPGGEGLE